jgi:hypothetical protein
MVVVVVEIFIYLKRELTFMKYKCKVMKVVKFDKVKCDNVQVIGVNLNYFK